MLYFLFRYTPVLFLHRILIHLVIAQSIPHLKFFSTKYIKFLTNSPLVDSFYLGLVAVRHMPTKKTQLLSCKHDVAVFFFGAWLIRNGSALQCPRPIHSVNSRCFAAPVWDLCQNAICQIINPATFMQA